MLIRKNWLHYQITSMDCMQNWMGGKEGRRFQLRSISCWFNVEPCGTVEPANLKFLHGARCQWETWRLCIVYTPRQLLQVDMEREL